MMQITILERLIQRRNVTGELNSVLNGRLTVGEIKKTLLGSILFPVVTYSCEI